MFMDNNTILSGSISGSTITGQALTTGTILSTNTYDAGTARDFGEGEDLLARIEVVTTFVGGTSVTVNVIEADDAALSTNVTVLGSSGAIVTANLAAGARFAIEINPRIGSTGRRYKGLQYVIVGTYTAGAVIGDFGVEVQDGQKFYPSGYAVL